MRKLLRIGLVLAFGLLVGCSSEFNPATAYKNMSKTQIYTSGEKSLKSGYYSDAIQYYQTLDARYPFADEAEKAQLHIIYAYYMNDDYVNALAASIRYIHLHPANPSVSYAYYMKALSEFQGNFSEFSRYLPIDRATRDLTSAKKAFLYFAEVVNRFPNSDYALDSKMHMIYLRNMMARHQLNVAKFYLERKAYVAAANRANAVVQHYQQTPYVPEALLVMNKAYNALGMTNLADQAILIYKYNHFGHPLNVKNLQQPKQAKRSIPTHKSS